ncbi:MAG: cell division protein SepF [Clostridiales bacterium]|nr:cell division protein SepF [Clostridiales bacterium]
MGFMDVFFDALRLNDDDDEFDNEEYDDFDDEDDDVEERHFFRRKPREEEPVPVRTSTRETRSNRTSNDTSQRRSSQAEPTIVRDSAENRSQKSQFRTTTARRSPAKREDFMEVSVVKPSTVEDERAITETLLNGRAVVINMEGLNVDIAQRIIDFTSGATFAIEGTLQKISNFIFIATPKNVDVSGDLQTIMDSVGGGSSFTF